MEVDTPVWVKNAQYEDLFSSELWLPAYINTKQINGKGEVTVTTSKNSRGEIATFTIPQGEFELDDLKFRNESDHQLAVENLNDLRHLNEPEIIAALKRRYFSDTFSCYIGPTLLHINPLKTVMDDNDEILEQFALQVKDHTTVSPEVWDAVSTLYKDIVAAPGKIHTGTRLNAGLKGKKRASFIGATTTVISAGQTENQTSEPGSQKGIAAPADLEDQKNHSIIISGEAGSGKTEASKQVLRYLLKQSVTASRKFSQKELRDLLGDDVSMKSGISEDAAAATADASKELESNNLGGRLSRPASGRSPSRADIMARAKTRSFAFYNALQVDIMDKIINANVILEAMGNAKLNRNKNSSRYGKYVEVGFNKSGALVGGLIRTYLLENARVSDQPADECNFHVFYQLVRGASASERVKWGITHESDHYHFLNQGLAASSRDIDDADEYEALRESFQFLELEDEVVDQFFGVIAGMIHLGQIQFQSVYDSSGESCYVVDRTPLTLVAKLFAIDANELEQTLTRRSTMVIRGESISKAMTVTQATSARDSFAKHMYKRIFQWVLDAVNEKLQPAEEAGRLTSSVGILDIFGFENFLKNSFDQLCINYACEALQQHFNESVFKMELIEFEQEQLMYDDIEYADNKEMIELIGVGILSLLDDQCRLPNPSDKKFAAKLAIKFEKNAQFKASTSDLRDATFVVVHYVGEVQYNSEGFIEKNLDDMPVAAEELVKHAKNVIVGDKARGGDGDQEHSDVVEHTHHHHRSGQSSLGSQFRHQLNHLLKQLRETIPHFIRCIKSAEKASRRRDTVPNNALARKISGIPATRHASVVGTGNQASSSPLNRTAQGTKEKSGIVSKQSDKAPFNQRKVADQLRATGVLDAVQASRSYFAVKLPFFDFYHSYRCIVNSTHPNASKMPPSITRDIPSQELRELCLLLLEALQNDKNVTMERKLKGKIVVTTVSRLQIGLHCCYLTRVDYDLLESGRHGKVQNAKLLIFTRCIAFMQRLWYKRALRSAELINRVSRGYQGRRTARIKGKHRFAVVSLQRAFRNKKYLRGIFMEIKVFRDNAVCIQKYARRVLGKNMAARVKEAREHYARTFGNLIIARDMRIARRRGEADVAVAGNVTTEMGAPGARIGDFRAEEVRLLAEINRMIAGTKVASQDALVRFDVDESRHILGEWARDMTLGPLRTSLLKLSTCIDYGHKLLRADKLIPLVGLSVVVNFTCRLPPETRVNSVKHANKRVTKSHKVFGSIRKLQGMLEELLRVAFKERKAALQHIENTKKQLVINIRRYGPEYQRTRAAPFYGEIQQVKEFVALADNIMRFGLVLYRYYQGYVNLIVKEYGDKSSYRADFGDDNLYLLSLAQLMEQHQPMHYAELYLHMANPDPDMDVCANFPLKLFSDAKNRVQLFEGVYYKFMPYAPGLDFTVNALSQFLQPTCLAPSRLIRISGKSADNYGQEAYYQASVDLSADNLVDVFNSPVLIEKLHIPSLSAQLLTSFVTGAGDARPENFMVRFVRDNTEDPDEITKIVIVGVSSDVVYRNTAFHYARMADPFLSCLPPTAESVGPVPGSGLNVLYFLPQMDEPVHPDIRAHLLQSKTLAEEMVCSWLRFLHQQNRRYELLKSTGGFTSDDFAALKLPIELPLGAAIRVHQRLGELRERLAEEDGEKVTHHMLLAYWYPELVDYYKGWRTSANKESISPILTNSHHHHHHQHHSGAYTGDSDTDSESASDSDNDSDKSEAAEGADVVLGDAAEPHGDAGPKVKLDFGKLTPFHRIYYDAVAHLESEAAALRPPSTTISSTHDGSRGSADLSANSNADQDNHNALGEEELESGLNGAANDAEIDEMQVLSSENGGSPMVSDSGGRPGSKRLSRRRLSRGSRCSHDGSEQGSIYMASVGSSVKFDHIYADSMDDDDDEFFEYESPPTPHDGETASERNVSFKFEHVFSNGSDEDDNIEHYDMSQTYGTKLKKVFGEVNSKDSGSNDGITKKDDIFGDNPLAKQRTPSTPTAPTTPEMSGSNPMAKLRKAAPASNGVVVNERPLTNVTGDKESATTYSDGFGCKNEQGLESTDWGCDVVDRDSGDGFDQNIESGNPMNANNGHNVNNNGKAVTTTGEKELESDALPDITAILSPSTGDALANDPSGGVADVGVVDITTPSVDVSALATNETEDEDEDEEEGESSRDESEITASSRSSVEDVALQFLMSIDFRRFDKEASKVVCRVMGDSLAFLDTLWLRCITEDQLKYMFEGYYEQQRLHRLAIAIASSRKGSMNDNTNTAEAAARIQDADGSEMYATKEVKLIGIPPIAFKRLQKTSTVRKMRRVLGIQVSLVVLVGADDSFDDILSDQSKAKEENNGDDVESDEEDAYCVDPETADFPDRYAQLQRKMQLVLRSYTNMVHTKSPEQISNDSTIIKEVVRKAATLKGAETISPELINQFGLIFIDFPGMAKIGKELADRGVFRKTNRIVHKLLAHPIIERYLEVISSILAQSPSLLLLKDKDDRYLLCDRIKALPDSKPFKYRLLCEFLNTIPRLYENDQTHNSSAAKDDIEHEQQGALRPNNTGTLCKDTGTIQNKLRGDEFFFTKHVGEEELIVRAVHYGFLATEKELMQREYDLIKTDSSTGERLVHRCVREWADNPTGPALKTFQMYLTALRARCVSVKMSQLEAESMLFSYYTNEQESVWSMCTRFAAQPMKELIVSAWLKTGIASGAPTDALMMLPAPVVKAVTKNTELSSIASQPISTGSVAAEGSGLAYGVVDITTAKVQPEGSATLIQENKALRENAEQAESTEQEHAALEDIKDKVTTVKVEPDSLLAPPAAPDNTNANADEVVTLPPVPPIDRDVSRSQENEESGTETIVLNTVSDTEDELTAQVAPTAGDSAA